MPVDLEIPPPHWPADRKSLILLWSTADQPNLVPDPERAGDRTYAVKPHGRARLNHDHAMLLVGDGTFQAEEQAGKSLVELAEKSNEITLEMTLTPRRVDAHDGRHPVLVRRVQGRAPPGAGTAGRRPRLAAAAQQSDGAGGPLRQARGPASRPRRRRLRAPAGGWCTSTA